MVTIFFRNIDSDCKYRENGTTLDRVMMMVVSRPSDVSESETRTVSSTECDTILTVNGNGHTMSDIFACSDKFNELRVRSENKTDFFFVYKSFFFVSTYRDINF